MFLDYFHQKYSKRHLTFKQSITCTLKLIKGRISMTNPDPGIEIPYPLKIVS